MRTRILRISIRDSLILILLVIFNTIHITDMANNNMATSVQSKSLTTKSDISESFQPKQSTAKFEDCPFQDQDHTTPCSSLNYPCIFCVRPDIDCIYGALDNYTCMVDQMVTCSGPRSFNRTAMCRFCYQTEKWEHRCEQKGNCNSLASPLKYYVTNCTVLNNVICLGKRRFFKKIRCSWTAGTQWGTALILALTLGGFGADRFYLGHWQEGIGKLFSFGGLGVWTLVDALLIGIHHLGPADGSLYI